MNLQLIRNATLRLAYGGHHLLIDPMLGPAHSIRSFAGVSKNPTVALPLAVEEIMRNVDAVLVSHLHPDHFDEAAQGLLSRDLPLFCQPVDAETIRSNGFTQVRPIAETVTWRGISLTRTPGRHGSGEMADRMGAVSGFVLQAAGEPTLYWLGDTIWYEAVAAVTAAVRPDILITHSGGAQFQSDGLILMDAAQTVAACLAAPQARVVAVHLEALDHCTVSRTALRAAAEAAGISHSRLLIPADGEQLELIA